MDCSVTHPHEERLSLTANEEVSAYSRAAKILSESSEITGDDELTTISLLMDFHRSLDYKSDDDAMSSLYD
jgi:hypothetical protein